MFTDEERREAARRLRKVVRDYGDCPAAVICDAIGIPGYGDYRDCYSGDEVLALADTIEGGADYRAGHYQGYLEGLQAAREEFDRDGGRVVPVAEVRVDGEHLEELVQEAVKKIGACDREALLVIADEMEKSVDRRKVRGYARRIREACGVKEVGK